MIPKVLFLALFCAAHVQCRPASSPQGNRNRVINTWNDVGNRDYTNENFNPNESGNGNADVNAGHSVLIIGSPPIVNKRVETHQPAANDNVMKGRPSRLPNENSKKDNPTGNTKIDTGNTGNVNGNLRPDEGGHGIADGNGSHQLIIGFGPPKVNNKVEMHQPTANDNVMEGRPARLPNENSSQNNPTGNTRIDMSNTGNVNGNSRPNEGEHSSADGNGSHQLVIGFRPPKVNNKVEMPQPTANDNVMEGRPSKLPNENSSQNNPTGNTRIDMGNTGNVNGNLRPVEGGNGNADGNGRHQLVIGFVPPKVNKKVEMHQPTANDNVIEGRPANSAHENPNLSVNALNDVANTNHVNKNFSPNDSGHGNADINAGHDVIIIHGPPQVNDNEVRQWGAASGNANNRPVHHRVPPMTEQRTQKPPVQIFADKVGQALGDAAKDDVDNGGKSAQSVFQVGKSVSHATGTILDAKANLIETVPRLGKAFFGALG